MSGRAETGVRMSFCVCVCVVVVVVVVVVCVCCLIGDNGNLSYNN